MVPLSTTALLAVIFCAMGFFAGRTRTIREAKVALEDLSKKSFAAIQALSKGICDEARLNGMDPDEHLQAIMQQAKKYGVTFAKIDAPQETNNG
jgi:hypothetical protein